MSIKDEINHKLLIEAKILIIDDNPVNILLLEKMLKISGYKSENIITTTDSREAISLYSSNIPDIILLDLQMPYLNGFQILEKLNEITEEEYLAVIVITAQNDKENHLKALQMGARDFIGKPFDHAEVSMRITNILEMKMMHKKVKDYSAVLEVKVTERTKELEDLQLDLINRLLMAAEFRDNDTGTHIKRIGLYSQLLAEKLGMPQEYCNLIKYSSMMHDIGKIAIPDNILLKSGKLNHEEWQKMKTHAEKGAEILRGSKYEILQMGEEIAMTHHEKWDGSGYPKGLSGEEIPLSGRITAVCDVFDALNSRRPYKEAWDSESSVEEIKKERNRHFDPKLVDIFLENIEEFLEIKNKNR